jgi:SsrA-binding protein
VLRRSSAFVHREIRDPMAQLKTKTKKGNNPFKEFGTVALNRRARFDYEIEETYEAGLQLHGSEVKSLRLGRCSINHAYAGPMEGELWLFNAHIDEYPPAMFQHEPKRPRKLLLHKKERDKLLGDLHQKGYTLVPMDLHFNKRGLAKLTIGLGRGKSKVDKREDIKKKDWERQKAKVLREYKKM